MKFEEYLKQREEEYRRTVRHTASITLEPTSVKKLLKGDDRYPYDEPLVVVHYANCGETKDFTSFEGLYAKADINRWEQDPKQDTTQGPKCLGYGYAPKVYVEAMGDDWE